MQVWTCQSTFHTQVCVICIPCILTDISMCENVFLKFIRKCIYRLYSTIIIHTVHYTICYIIIAVYLKTNTMLIMHL